MQSRHSTPTASLVQSWMKQLQCLSRQGGTASPFGMHDLSRKERHLDTKVILDVLWYCIKEL